MRPVLPCVLAAAVAIGCDSSGNVALPSIDDGLPATCSPLRTPGLCMMPWPNALYEIPDSSTRTGLRVHLSAETLPVARSSMTQLDPAIWNSADGFSPATPILFCFPEAIDPA